MSRRLPDALAAEFLSSLGRGGEKNIYIFIRRAPRRVRSPPRPHLSASMVTLAFCSALACWETAAGQPAGCAGAAGVHMLCCCPGGEAVGQAGLKAPCCGSGGAGGGGEVAMEATGLLLLKLSEALRRENMVRASGKLGGVAGVLAGVHICGKETWGQGSPSLLPPTRAWHETPLPPCCGIRSPQTCALLTVLPVSSSISGSEGSCCAKSSWQRAQTGTPLPSQVGDPLCSTTHWCHPGPAAFWLCGHKAQLPSPRRLGMLQPCWALALHAPNPQLSQRVKQGR